MIKTLLSGLKLNILKEFHTSSLVFIWKMVLSTTETVINTTGLNTDLKSLFLGIIISLIITSEIKKFYIMLVSDFPFKTILYTTNNLAFRGKCDTKFLTPSNMN